MPRLLELLDLNGKTVTVDAKHCQKKTAQTIRDARADYLMQVKANQKTLHEDVKLFFDEAIDKYHGRIETRRCWSTWDIDWLKRRTDWPGLKSIVFVEALREVKGKTSSERRYYLRSRDDRDGQAMLAAVRGHWSIENQLHWCLDVCFGENDHRLRQGHSAENFSRLNRLVMNLLRQDHSIQVGLNAKRKRAGWDHDNLLPCIHPVFCSVGDA